MIKPAKIRVAVIGYGVIGNRVAAAVRVQDDMQLVGVADIVADWRPKVCYTGRQTAVLGAATKDMKVKSPNSTSGQAPMTQPLIKS